MAVEVGFCHDAHGNSHFQHLVLPVLPDDAHGLFILDVLINAAGCKQVLNHLVAFPAKARIADRHLRQLLGVGRSRIGHGRYNGIHLLLRHLRQDGLRPPGLFDQIPHFLDRSKVLIQRHGIHSLPPCALPNDSSMPTVGR